MRINERKGKNLNFLLKSVKWPFFNFLNENKWKQRGKNQFFCLSVELPFVCLLK